MCLEVKSNYQKSSWSKSLFWAVLVQGLETNLRFWGLQDTLDNFGGTFRGGMLLQKILKMETLRLAKNALPAYS